MDQDKTRHGSTPRPRPHCVRWGPSSPQNGAQQPPLFGPCLLWPSGRPSQQLVSSCFPSRIQTASSLIFRYTRRLSAFHAHVARSCKEGTAFRGFTNQKFIDTQNAMTPVVSPMSDVLLLITSITSLAAAAAGQFAIAWPSPSSSPDTAEMSAEESIHFGNVANIRLSLMVRNVGVRVLTAERDIDVYC